MLFERTANIQKEARNGPFLKYRFFDLPNLIFGVVVLIGSRKIIDDVDDEMKKKKTEERNCGSSVTKNQTGERERERERERTYALDLAKGIRVLASRITE